MSFPAHSMKSKFLQWFTRPYMNCPPCFHSDLISYSSPHSSFSYSLAGLLVLLGIHEACFHFQAFPLAVPSSSILFPHNLLFQIFLKCYLKNESFRDQIILNDIFVLQPPPSHSPSILYFNSPIYFSLLLLSSSNRQNIFISLVCCLPSLSRMYIMLHDGRDFLLFFLFFLLLYPSSQIST